MRDTEAFKVESVAMRHATLTVICSGDFGYGSGGNDSARRICQSIEVWMDSNAGAEIARIAIDFTRVDYLWGDGPVSGVVFPLLKRNREFVILSNRRNDGPLRDLVRFAVGPMDGARVEVRLGEGSAE